MSKAKDSNLTIKVLSIFIAIVLWSYVISEVNPRVTKELNNIKVDIINEHTLKNSGLVLIEPRDVRVSVKVKGRRNDINNLDPNDIIAKADLLGYSEGVSKVYIDVKVPLKLDIEDVRPRQVSFKIDSIVSKEKRVSIKTTGTSSEGYSIEDGQLSPETVTVKGARSYVNSVSKVIANVNINDIRSSKNLRVPLIAVDSKGKQVKKVDIEPRFTEVSLPVLRTKKVPVVPKTRGTLPNGYTISKMQVVPSVIGIKGLNEDIKNVNALQIEPIDITNLSANKEFSSRVILPNGVNTVGGNKVAVKIELERTITRDIDYDMSQISFLNLAEGLNIVKDNLPPKVIVSIRGKEKLVNKISTSDLKLSVDLNGLSEGDHIIKITPSQIEGLEILQINPNSLPITLRKNE
ncbi:YbbR family protein [Gottschalkia purinilytica]|uniref:YbbR family protein n=1 Tax=Gottschalkia purinilytica TaxID=1503 RepID=A0A0L0WAR3_GOTPU|nr:CdaR family protein [Gottschalkia purinilytica]KNF08581.1 YbbR family protein [Gottschalkia purinilytica]